MRNRIVTKPDTVRSDTNQLLSAKNENIRTFRRGY
jgi:hypothetical protein